MIVLDLIVEGLGNVLVAVFVPGGGVEGRGRQNADVQGVFHAQPLSEIRDGVGIFVIAHLDQIDAALAFQLFETGHGTLVLVIDGSGAVVASNQGDDEQGDEVDGGNSETQIFEPGGAADWASR